MTTKVILARAPAEARRIGAHLHNWDRLRVVASLDIIGSHLTGTHLLGGVGLPVFLIMSIALAVRRAEPGDGAVFVRKRIARVVAPWLFWSLAIAVELTLRGDRPSGWFRPRMFLYGPEIHLWFLPFSAAASVAAFAVQRANPPEWSRRAAHLAFVSGVVALGLCPWFERGWPIEQWGFSLPAICVGFAIGRLLSSDAERLSARLELLPLAAAFVACAVLLMRSFPAVAPYATRHAGAVVLVTLALWLPNPPDPFSRRLVPSLLGVYILHPAVYRELVEPLMRATGVALGADARIALDFTLAVLVVSLMQKTPLRRVL